MKKFIIVLFIIPLLQGCGAALVAAGVGYAIGQGRQGTAKLMEAKSKYLERYNTYKIDMEKINLEREKAGLKPQPIQNFEDWLSEQPLTPEEQKLYVKSKAQTPKEIKQQAELKETKRQGDDKKEPTTNFGAK